MADTFFVDTPNGYVELEPNGETEGYKDLLSVVSGLEDEFYMDVVMYGTHNTVVGGWCSVDWDDRIIYWEHPCGTMYEFSLDRCWFHFKNNMRFGLADFEKDYCSAMIEGCEPDDGLLEFLGY